MLLERINKEMKRYKKIISITSKVLIGLVLVLLGIMIAMSAKTKSDEVVMPSWFGIVSIVVILALIVVYIVMFVLHLIKIVQNGKYIEIVQTIIAIPVCTVGIMIASKVMGSDSMTIRSMIVMASVISLGNFASKFWKD